MRRVALVLLVLISTSASRSDAGRFLCGDWTGSRIEISELDPETGARTPLASDGVPEWSGVVVGLSAIDPAGRVFFVVRGLVEPPAKTLVRVDPATGAIAHVPILTDAYDVIALEWDRVNERLVGLELHEGLADEDGDVVRMIALDPETGAVQRIGGILRLRTPTDGIALDPIRGRLFVSTVRKRGPAFVVELDTRFAYELRRWEIPHGRLDFPTRLAWDPVQRRVLLDTRVHPDVHFIDAIDVDSGELLVLAELPEGGSPAHQGALDPCGRRWLLSNEALFLVDADDGAELSSLPQGSSPLWIEWHDPLPCFVQQAPSDDLRRSLPAPPERRRLPRPSSPH